MTKLVAILPKPDELVEEDKEDQIQRRVTMKPKRNKRNYQCVECDEIFTNYANLKEHEDNCLSAGAKGALYICQYCNVLLENFSELDTHESNCHTDGKYECFCCKKRFIQKGHLHNHAQKAHDYKSLQYYCMLCIEAAKTTTNTTTTPTTTLITETTRFDTKSELNNHFKEVHTTNTVCNTTNTDIATNLTADDEDDVEMQDLEWLDDCLDMDNLSFNTSWEAFDFDLSKVLNATSEAGDDNSSKSVSPPPFLQPKARSKSQSSFICPLCPFECDKSSILIKHVACKHNDETNTTQQNQFICVYCKKEFTQILHYKRHLDRKHIFILKHECFFCQRAFSTMDHLKKHVLSLHQNERRFFCTHCSAAFTQSGHLKQHLDTHSGVKRYQCPQCVKGFHRSIDLKRHKCKAKLNGEDGNNNDT